jgi:hypothetical protein
MGTAIDDLLERALDVPLRAVGLGPPRPFSYALCPHCLQVRFIRQSVALAAWVGFLAMLLAALITGWWGLWGMIAFLLFFVAVFSTAASSVRFKNGDKEAFGPRF